MKQFRLFMYEICILILVTGLFFMGLISPALGITSRTFYPYPYAAYNVVKVRTYIEGPAVRDSDDPYYQLDPDETSVFADLKVEQFVRVLKIQDFTEPSKYFIHLAPQANNPTLNPSGMMRLGSQLQVDKRIYMENRKDPGYPAKKGPKGPGKAVWGDIAEGIRGVQCGTADIVVIHPNIDDTVIISQKAYDTTVAGVISDQPPVYLQPLEGGVPLAIAGIVYGKVCTENGPIEVGDLLVTSTISGHAMKADQEKLKPGMVIGKALEPFGFEEKETKGKIAILINTR